MIKQCSRCKEYKSLEQFHKRSRGGKTELTERAAYCRTCHNVYKRAYGMTFWSKLHFNVTRKGEPVSIDDLKSLGMPNESNCYLCGLPIVDNWEIDHIVPRSKGGTNQIGNLRWTHRVCNRIKHDLLLDELSAALRQILTHLDT